MKKRFRAVLTGLTLAALCVAVIAGCGGGAGGGVSQPATGKLAVTGDVVRAGSRQTSPLAGAALTVEDSGVTGTFDASGHMTLTGLSPGRHNLSLAGNGSAPGASPLPVEIPTPAVDMLMTMHVNLDENGVLQSVSTVSGADADHDGAMDDPGDQTLTLPDGTYAIHHMAAGQTEMHHGGMTETFVDANGDFIADGSSSSAMTTAGGMGGVQSGAGSGATMMSGGGAGSGGSAMGGGEMGG